MYIQSFPMNSNNYFFRFLNLPPVLQNVNPMFSQKRMRHISSAWVTAFTAPVCEYSLKNWNLLHSKDILYALTSNEFSPWNSQVLCIDFIIQCQTTCIVVQICVSTPISLNFASKSTSQICFRISRNLKSL